METNLIRLMIDVARHGSFAGAARQHRLDPSSISRTVAQIEAELGFRIFQRTTRSMSLTEAVVGSRLFDTTYRVCASRAYLKKAPGLRRPTDISAVACVLFTLPEFSSRWLFRDSRGAVTEIPVKGDIFISNALALRECALAGLGPALLPNWLIDDDIAGRRLINLFPAYRVTATTFDTAAFVVYPNRAFLPNKIRLTIDFLRRQLKQSGLRLRHA